MLQYATSYVPKLYDVLKRARVNQCVEEEESTSTLFFLAHVLLTEGNLYACMQKIYLATCTIKNRHASVNLTILCGSIPKLLIIRTQQPLIGSTWLIIMLKGDNTSLSK